MPSSRLVMSMSHHTSSVRSPDLMLKSAADPCTVSSVLVSHLLVSMPELSVTRHQINYPETYDQIFHRTSAELQANPAIKHLILLLGVPIAYPRLQWLENILQSPLVGPIRFLNKRFGVAGGLFNQFDGQVDCLMIWMTTTRLISTSLSVES